MKNNKFSILERLKSFKYAFSGLKILVKEEHNSWIHLTATVLVIILGFLFHITSSEWFAVIISIGLVLSMEALNSAVENLADFVTQAKQPLIKKAKDLAAAAVLCSAIAAFTIGLIIFLPKIIDKLQL